MLSEWRKNRSQRRYSLVTLQDKEPYSTATTSDLWPGNSGTRIRNTTQIEKQSQSSNSFNSSAMHRHIATHATVGNNAQSDTDHTTVSRNRQITFICVKVFYLYCISAVHFKTVVAFYFYNLFCLNNKYNV